MKRIIFLCLLALFSLTGVFAQQQLPVVAVAPFEAISGVTAEEARMITRVFFILLGNTRHVDVRNQTIVEQVLREHNFQAGDWSNAEKTAELGRALNANWIVQGEIEKWGANTLVTVQFYDIQSFRFMGGTHVRYPSTDDPYDKIEPLVDNLVSTIGGSGSSVRTSAQPGRTYQIGDTGPAGGIVFYDKGVFSNGWRYLEAAPHDLGPVQWGAHGQNVRGTEIMVGGGKRNTELIVEHLRRSGETNRAAQLCANYDVNGFTDWFLPSKDELNLMYQNLKRRNLGSFGDRIYWSSSQGGTGLAWGQRFSDGSQSANDFKVSAASVRAVRAF